MDNISEIDKHFLDPFIKCLAKPCLIILFALFCFGAAVIISICTQNSDWVTRFSSLITIAGVLLTMSPTFEKGIYLSQSQARRYGSLDEVGRTVTTTEEERKMGQNVFYGLIITVVGTALWGFGDLAFECICALLYPPHSY